MGEEILTASAQQTPIAYEVDGKFEGKKPGKTAKDLSGVACMPAKADGSRMCLFVNDESRQVQFATISARTITPGAILPLIGEGPDETTVGTPPAILCPNGETEFGEFDGEGIAYAAPYFYIVGSHGCSRKGGEIRLSSFLLARIRVDAEGRPADADGAALPEEEWQEAVETTYRLSDYLLNAEPVGAFFAKSLDEEANGLNIEGVAVQDGQLLVGLRAPTLDGSAFLVAAGIDRLFQPGAEPADERPEVIPLKLGEDMGIRDLASLPDGRLLVLAGPAQEQDLPFALFAADPRGGGTVTPIGELDPVESEEEDEPAKAECVTVLSADAGEVRVLVLFDALKNGGPRELRFQLE